MNVFVLGTGRCGTETFSKACEHITNFTAAHQSMRRAVGEARFDYPDNHIEADPRLCWFLGRVDRIEKPDTIYVHLDRDPEKVTISHAVKLKEYIATGGLVKWRDEYGKTRTKLTRSSQVSITYFNSLLAAQPPWNRLNETPPEYSEAICRDMVDTMKANIEVFLRGRPHMNISIETAKVQFPELWQWIGAEGDMDAAIREFDIHYNATPK